MLAFLMHLAFPQILIWKTPSKKIHKVLEVLDIYLKAPGQILQLI